MCVAGIWIFDGRSQLVGFVTSNQDNKLVGNAIYATTTMGSMCCNASTFDGEE